MTERLRKVTDREVPGIAVAIRNAARHRDRETLRPRPGLVPPGQPALCRSPFVEHLGGGAGFFNLIRIYPAQAVGIVIMGSATNYPIDAIARLALTRT